jgi:hypothetical protein
VVLVPHDLLRDRKMQNECHQPQRCKRCIVSGTRDETVPKVETVEVEGVESVETVKPRKLQTIYVPPSYRPRGQKMPINIELNKG